MPEEESLETTSENRHRGCGRDMFGQTVPSTGSSNREGPCGQWTAMYDGHSATVRKQIEGVSGPWNQPCTQAHWRDTMVLSHADLFKISLRLCWFKSDLMRFGRIVFKVNWRSLIFDMTSYFHDGGHNVIAAASASSWSILHSDFCWCGLI